MTSAAAGAEQDHEEREHPERRRDRRGASSAGWPCRSRAGRRRRSRRGSAPRGRGSATRRPRRRPARSVRPRAAGRAPPASRPGTTSRARLPPRTTKQYPIPSVAAARATSWDRVTMSWVRMGSAASAATSRAIPRPSDSCSRTSERPAMPVPTARWMECVATTPTPARSASFTQSRSPRGVAPVGGDAVNGSSPALRRRRRRGAARAARTPRSRRRAAPRSPRGPRRGRGARS